MTIVRNPSRNSGLAGSTVPQGEVLAVDTSFLGPAQSIHRLASDDAGVCEMSQQKGYPTRAEQRAAGRELAKLLVRQDKKEAGFRWDITLAFVGLGMAILLTFVPPQTKIAAIFWLIALYGVFVYPALHLAEWLIRSEKKLAIRVGALTFLACVVLAFATYVWPHGHRHKLDKKEIAAFKQALGKPSTTVKESVQVACPSDDEKVCVYASQFIEYLGQAGWDVYGKVDKVNLALPHEGVVLVEHGGQESTQPKWQDIGAWTPITDNIESLVYAFRAIGICPDGSAGPGVPEGLIVISFGEEREDESSPTGLLESVTRLRKLKIMYPPDGVPPWESHEPGAVYIPKP